MIRALALSVLAALTAQAQVTLPAPDAQGWIKLFRGTNTADFYSHTTTGQTNGAFPSATFAVRGDTVQVSGTPTGHFAIRQSFSHYQISVEMRHVTSGNAGMLLHVRENEPSLGVYPRSLECQGNNNGMGELWTISDVWVNVRVADSNARPRVYSPTGTEVTHGDPHGRQCRGSSNPVVALGGWDTLQAVVHGADSVRHITNGVSVLRYSRIRVAPDNAPTNYNTPLDSGRISWQSEGAQVWYRNIRIRLFPGDPLYTPTYLEYHRRHGIHPPQSPKKILVLENGVLGIRDGSGLVFDARGRSGIRLPPLTAGSLRR